MPEPQKTTFTQADIDALTAKHAEELKKMQDSYKGETDRKVKAAILEAKAEAEKAAKQANMSELEKANSELEEWKAKYQEKEDIISLANQKDETRKLMSELGVDEKCLDFVFVPKDIEGTKARVKGFKEYIDNVKKETFEKNIKSEIPGTNDKQNSNPVSLRGAIEDFYSKK